MSRKRRVIFAIAFVEMSLAATWFFLAQNGIDNPGSVTPDFQQTLGETMGQAMGAFLGFGVLMMFVAAKNDRASATKLTSGDPR